MPRLLRSLWGICCDSVSAAHFSYTARGRQDLLLVVTLRSGASLSVGIVEQLENAVSGTRLASLDIIISLVDETTNWRQFIYSAASIFQVNGGRCTDSLPSKEDAWPIEPLPLIANNSFNPRASPAYAAAAGSKAPHEDVLWVGPFTYIGTYTYDLVDCVSEVK